MADRSLVLDNIVLIISRSHLSIAQLSSSFKRLDTRTFMHATPTLITEALHLVTRVQLLLTTVTVNQCLIQCQLTLMGLVYTMCTNSKAMPITIMTTDVIYRCRTCLTNRMGSISRHIMPLVISSLGGGHTHKHTYRCPHRSNFKKPGVHQPVAGARLV